MVIVVAAVVVVVAVVAVFGVLLIFTVPSLMSLYTILAIIQIIVIYIDYLLFNHSSFAHTRRKIYASMQEAAQVRVRNSVMFSKKPLSLEAAQLLVQRF